MSLDNWEYCCEACGREISEENFEEYDGMCEDCAKFHQKELALYVRYG